MGSDKDGKIFVVDVIEHQNALWVIPEWLGNPSLDYEMPVRMIRIEKSHYQEMSGAFETDILITYPIPSSIMEGLEKRLKGEEYETIENPGIKVPLNFKPH